MDLESRERLAVLVKQARGQMTKSAFAEALGVSHTTVGSWEQGTFMPDLKSALRIAEILGISVEEFIYLVEGKPLSLKREIEPSQIVRQIRDMPPKDLAVIGRAVTDRLEAISESLITQLKGLSIDGNRG